MEGADETRDEIEECGKAWEVRRGEKQLAGAQLENGSYDSKTTSSSFRVTSSYGVARRTY